MKILIAGPELVKKNDRYMDEKSWSFMKAFERAGLDADYFVYKPGGVFRFVEKDKHLKKIWHVLMNRRLIDIVRQTRPDILALIKASSVEGETLRELRRTTDTIIINIMNDNPLLMGNFDALAPCHYYFVKDTYVLTSLERAGFKNIRYLPQACDTTIRRRLELEREDREIFSSEVMLMGSMYPYRLKLVEELIDFRPAIWGTGWKKTSNAEIRRLYKGRGVWGKDKTKAICGAAISLNPHHPLNDIKGTPSRTFDIAACGGFQLAEHKDDLEDLFEIGKELICYRTIDELREMIKYYLLHPEKREEIGLAGQNRVLQEHTFDHRVRQILDTVSK